MSGRIVASNVHGNTRQVIVELVSAIVDRASDRPWELCAVKRKMGERDNLVITAMVEEEPGNCGKLFSTVARKLKVVEVPMILVPRRGSKQEQARNFALDLLL